MPAVRKAPAVCYGGVPYNVPPGAEFHLWVKELLNGGRGWGPWLLLTPLIPLKLDVALADRSYQSIRAGRKLIKMLTLGATIIASSASETHVKKKGVKAKHAYRRHNQAKGPIHGGLEQ